MNIKVKYFKTIKECNLDFSENIICLIGENGSGKSNVLDSINHIKNNSNDNSIIMNDSSNYDEDFKKKLKIEFEEELTDNEKDKIINILTKYNISFNEKLVKKFWKTYDSLLSIISSDTVYFKLNNLIYENAISVLVNKYSNLDFIQKSGIINESCKKTAKMDHYMKILKYW